MGILVHTMILTLNLGSSASHQTGQIIPFRRKKATALADSVKHGATHLDFKITVIEYKCLLLEGRRGPILFQDDKR